MLDKEHLKNYINGFYGYGKWSNQIYILGIEEAGGYSEDLVREKLQRFIDKQNDDGLFDNKDFQYGLRDPNDPKLKNYSDFFDGKTKKNGYVPKVALFLKTLEDYKKDKNEYIKEMFGRTESNHALIELFPLPCPKVRDWFYPDWVDISLIPELKTKKMYREHIMEKRAEFIRKKISETTIKRLVFVFSTSKSSTEMLNKILPSGICMKSFKRFRENEKILFHETGIITYFILPFPGSRFSNSIFNGHEEIIKIAKEIKSYLK